MEKKTKIIVGIGIFLILFLALALKFNVDSDTGLNDYEETVVITDNIDLGNNNYSSINETTEILVDIILVFVQVTVGIIVIGMIIQS